MKYIIWIFFLLAFHDCKSQGLFPFRMDTLWGYKNKQGLIIIEPQYHYATSFMGNFAVVARNGKLGLINSSNSLIIPFRYEYLRPLDTAAFLFGYRAKYFGEYIIGVMTKEEKVIIPAQYSYISKFKNTYTVTKNKDSIIGRSDMMDIRTVKRSEGLYDNKGNVLIPCKFHSINWTTDSLLVVDSAYLSADGKYLKTCSALFSSTGKQLTEFKYMVFGKFIEGVAKARIENKFGFIYPSGKVAIPIKFDYCEDFQNGFALIKQNEKWGAINKEGIIVIETLFKYQEVKNSLQASGR